MVIKIFFFKYHKTLIILFIDLSLRNTAIGYSAVPDGENQISILSMLVNRFSILDPLLKYNITLLFTFDVQDQT